jgi:hypothetical protein
MTISNCTSVHYKYYIILNFFINIFKMQKQTGLKKILSVIDVGLEFNIYTGVYMWVPIFF